MTALRLGPAALALLALAAGAAAADPKPIDPRDLDKQVVDSLRVVHNLGADLYNEGKNFDGAYRMYQGALLAVRPLLGHRPEVQKRIDAGLAAADKEADAARRAFLLHEAIEAARSALRAPPAEAKKPDPPVKPPEEPKGPPLPLAPPPRAKPRG